MKDISKLNNKELINELMQTLMFSTGYEEYIDLSDGSLNKNGLNYVTLLKQEILKRMSK